MDNWGNLIKRLQTMCESKRYNSNHKDEALAIITINLLYSDNVLIGWYQPQRIPLEPRVLDYELLDLDYVENWGRVKGYLQGRANQDITSPGRVKCDAMLVVKDGRPLGFMRQSVYELA